MKSMGRLIYAPHMDKGPKGVARLLQEKEHGLQQPGAKDSAVMGASG